MQELQYDINCIDFYYFHGVEEGSPDHHHSTLPHFLNTWNSYSWIRIQEHKPFSLYHWTHKSQNFVISSKYGPAVILFVDIKTFELQCSCCWPLPAIIIPHITVTRLMQHFIACECKRHVQQTWEQCVNGWNAKYSVHREGPFYSFVVSYYLFHTQGVRILANQVITKVV